MNNMDWDLIRSFLSVAQNGSISGAARELSLSQPTISRNIQALEAETRLNLFKRTTQGITLTEDGKNLIEAAEKMEAAANLFQLKVSGRSTELSGDVRISVNEIIGIYLLPPAISAFRRLHPAVNIEMVITNETSSLIKREADIALRMFRPSQPDLLVKRLPDMELGFYATEDYLADHPEPRTAEQLLKHTLIGFDRSMEFIENAEKLGFHLVRDNFALRTDNLLAQINLARSGAGIVGTHVGLVHHWPELVRILEWIELPPLEFWLVCHQDTQFNSRIRALQQFLTTWFSDGVYRRAVM